MPHVVVRPRPWVRSLASLVAALVPFGFAAAGAAASPQWRDDIALVRAVDLLVSPGSGAVGSLALQFSLLLPLGPIAYRGALVAALSLAAIGLLLFHAVRRALSAIAPSRIDDLVALAAALTATLSASLQREGNVTGGATFAVALALGAMLLVMPEHAARAAPTPRAHVEPSGHDLPPRRWLAFGALAALTTLESASAGLALAVATLTLGAFRRPARGSHALALSLVGAAATAALVLLPLVARPLGPRALLDLAAGSGLAELRTLDVAHLQGRGLARWVDDLGVSAFVLSCVGLAIGFARPAARHVIAPLALLLALDLALPPRNSGVLTADPLAALRGLSICCASAAAAVGVHGLALALHASKLSLAHPASVLVVAFHLTLAAMSAEEGAARAFRSTNSGVDAWTSEAFESLPPRALVLVRSDAVAWRLWSSKVVSGRRPDVTVVPLPLLGHGSLAAGLLADEPGLLPLLRDVSSSGAPGEFALSKLADARPLFVEFDPRWGRTLASHAIPDRLWLRFAPQPLGLSDRRAAQSSDQQSFARTAAAARRDDAHDQATLEVLATHAREQAGVAALVTDRELAQRALGQLTSLDREPDEALWPLLDPARRPEARPRSTRRAAR